MEHSMCCTCVLHKMIKSMKGRVFGQGQRGLFIYKNVMLNFIMCMCCASM